jgi:hypothetical protein
LGRQFGVRFVCVADISSVYEATFVAARMINVETAVVTATAERDKEINGMADLTELADDIADGLLNNVAPCNKKGKPAEKKGCCDGLVAIDGICSDLSEYVKIKCGLEILLKKTNDEQRPEGWRIPTADDLISLSKIQVVLSSIIPIRVYRTNEQYSNTYWKTVPYCSEMNLKGTNSVMCGSSGFYSVDLKTGGKNSVKLEEGKCSSCWNYDNNNFRTYTSDLPYPPFWVR